VLALARTSGVSAQDLPRRRQSHSPQHGDVRGPLLSLSCR
jgi:hypothetical protein